MNCHLCGNKLVIRTDPKNCDYIVYSGLEKRVNKNNYSIYKFIQEKEENENNLSSGVIKLPDSDTR